MRSESVFSGDRLQGSCGYLRPSGNASESHSRRFSFCEEGVTKRRDRECDPKASCSGIRLRATGSRKLARARCYFKPGACGPKPVSLVCYRVNQDVRTDFQCVFFFHAIAVGVGKLFPAVAEIKLAVYYGQSTIDRDAFQFGRVEGAVILANARRVLHVIDVVVAVIQRVVIRQANEFAMGQHFRNLPPECHVERDPSTTGVSHEQAARRQIVLQSDDLFIAPMEFVMPGHIEDRIGRRLRISQLDFLPLELNFQGRTIPRMP